MFIHDAHTTALTVPLLEPCMPKTRRRRNPTGTILVNPAKRSKRAKRSSSKSRKAVSLAGLFAKLNPSKRHRGSKRRGTKRRGSKRNPVLMNRRRRSMKRGARRSNPVHRMNPSKRRRSSGRRRSYGRKSNPVIVNRRKRNPSLPFGLQGILGRVQGMLRKVPLVGPIVASALGGLGGAAAGAIAVVPADMALPYVAKWIPDWLRPYAYTAVSLSLSALVEMIPAKIPFKRELAIGLTFAGGAVDTFRYRRGMSQSFGDAGGDYAGADEYGDADLGGDDLGNDGSPLAAVEFAEANLADADYCPDDLSGDEMAAIEMGRAAYRRKYRQARNRGAESGPGRPSEHAGQPGNRWGWLIYVLGFDGFQKVAAMPDMQRREWIQRFKTDAKLLARKMLSQGMSTDVSTAETAGLLVAA